MTGMVFPFHNDIKELKVIVSQWLQHKVDIVENFTNIYIDLIGDGFVLIRNPDIFYSAYNDPELWQELLVDLPIRDWTIFFECEDSCDSCSYLIYKNNIEVRRILQEEDEELYCEGEIQAFEEAWFDHSIYYEHEYLDEKGKLKTKRVGDPDFSIEAISDADRESYFKYYQVTSKNVSMYHTALARVLLVELFEHYLGFDIIDKNYKVNKSLKLDSKKIPKLEKMLKRANAGDVISQNELGKMYENGNGVPQDYASARHWYLQAASQEDACGLLNLASLYRNGYGVAKDVQLALQWVVQAVALSSADAQAMLGEMYEMGEGVEQSFDEASKLYRQAAKQRNAVAPYRLGLMYEYGRGFEIDLKMAKRWYYQAVSNFNEEAQKRLDELNKYS